MHIYRYNIMRYVLIIEEAVNYKKKDDETYWPI